MCLTKFYWKFPAGFLAFVLSFLSVLTNAQSTDSDILINEVMASNAQTLADEDGDYSDWLELYNQSNVAVNLLNWALSDDEADPLKWLFPDVTIEPGGYLVVFASNKDKASATGELHTNFAISAGGEEVVLSDASGTEVHRHNPVAMETDVSYGLAGDLSGSGFFDAPSPGSTNPIDFYNEILEVVPVFSHSGGFYESGFQLTLTTDEPDAQIYYTLDGSVPDPANVGGNTYDYVVNYPNGDHFSRDVTTYLYTAPIDIVDRSDIPYEIAAINTRYSTTPTLPRSNIFKGTVVRARVVKESAISDKTATHSYFVAPGVSDRYDIPVVSLVTDEPHLFDYETGIYVAGKLADDWYNANPEEEWDQNKPANYHQSGDDWEYPAHFEYFDEDMNPAVRQNIGIRMHGGATRAFARKSIRLYARSDYDDQSSLNYPFFGDLPSRGDFAQTVTSFDRMILRNSGNDYYDALYRDALMQDLVKHLPFAVQASQPVVHFINGEYWGLMNLRERFDEDYVAAHYHIDADDVAILETWGQVDEGIPGDETPFFDVVNYADDNDLNIPEHFEWVEQRVDIESLAQYYAAQFYFYNTDWPDGNMKYWRKRTTEYHPEAPTGHDGRWRWMLYDTDFGMNLYYEENYLENSITQVMDGTAHDPSSRLLRQLLTNEAFKNHFANIMADQLNSCFQPEYVVARIDSFENIISPYRLEHWNRWDNGKHADDKMKTFALNRPDYLRNHAIEEFGLGDVVSLEVARAGDGGLVKVNSILLDEALPGLVPGDPVYPWTGQYFAGTPVTLKAVNTPNYLFSHWEGVASEFEGEQEVILPLDASKSVTAVFQSRQSELIHYWHFNTLPDGELGSQTSDFSRTQDAGLISFEGESAGYMDAVSDGTTMNSRLGVAEGLGLRVRNPSETRELVFELPTTGYEAVTMKYAVKRTSSGSQLQSIFYRTQSKGTWIPVLEEVLITPDYHIVEVDFTGEDGVDNNPDFAVRIVFPHESAAGTSGNNRFDNVSLEGYAGENTNTSGRVENLDLLVYPTPADEVLHIDSRFEINRVGLFNVSGKLILEEQPGTFSHQLNVGSFQSGTYLLEVYTPVGQRLKKIMIK